MDGRAWFETGRTDNAKIIFQVKSGGVARGDVARLRGDMQRENAAFAVLAEPRPLVSIGTRRWGVATTR